MNTHTFEATVRWTGDKGSGTSAHGAYSRDHEISGPGKPVLPGSSDPAFRGDASRYNPEELLVASLSACHMLWYLGLCAKSGVRVLAYSDDSRGTMALDADGGGRFTGVELRPRVTVATGSDLGLAERLHHVAAEKCFIANSVNFEVLHSPSVTEAPDAPAQAA